MGRRDRSRDHRSCVESPTSWRRSRARGDVHVGENRAHHAGRLPASGRRMTSDPLISVVIVTWNGRQYLEACLTAVAAQVGVRVETILVDNASSDGTVAYVGERFPSVRVVSLSENRGFAGGNNAGVREARGEFVALLNNDTVPESTWLQTLVSGVDGGVF